MIDNNHSIQNSHLSISELDFSSKTDQSSNNQLEKPDPTDVSDFDLAMSDDKDDAKTSEGSSSDKDMKKMLMMLIQLLMSLLDPNKDKKAEGSKDGDDKSTSSPSKTEGRHSPSSPSESSSKPNKAEASESASEPSKTEASDSPSSPAKVENNPIINNDNIAEGDSDIPEPSEHLQSFNLGDKQINIGGDGSASAAEVEQTKDSLTDLYQNSNSFKEMIDSSPNDSFEVTVGRRDDNTSLGNADGRIFMNINNIEPKSSDNFQSLSAHEFAHAGINQQHGDTMRQFEQTVAHEA